MGEHQHDEIARLREDQAKWRKGVALIAAYLGEKQPDNLCCVRIANVALKMRAERDSLRAQVERLESVPDVIARLRAELKLMEHKVITCGVAATNPDAGLTLRDGYMQWTSPQADAVRALRAERDSLLAELEALRGRTGCCAECARLRDELGQQRARAEAAEAALRQARGVRL